MKHPLDPDGPWHVVVTDTGNKDYNFMILIHELIEAYLTKRAGIPEEDITDFDRRFEVRRAKNEVGPDDEPGDDPTAPYFKQHQCAIMIENLLCGELGINAKMYDLDLDDVLKRLRP